MEKKNVIFLSVIAVATLLTAVIGTTFAYFTANFTVSNKENATSTVNTKTLVGTTVTLGDKIDPGDAIYPGFRGVQKIEVKGTDTGDVDGQVTLKVTPNIPTDFGSDLEWTLYQSDKAAITCEAPVTKTTTGVDGGNQVYQETTCSDDVMASAAKAIATSSDTTAKTTATITVKKGETHNFYLVVNFKNTTSNQVSLQGKTFTFSVEASQVDNTTTR